MTDKATAFAALLLAARRGGRRLDVLPPGLVPGTADEAYAVQDEVAAALGRIAGWKVGAASPEAEPNCAPLFADLVAASPARWPASLAVDGKEVASAVGGNAAGHPRRLLAWLANHCARRGRGLLAGDIVTTGTHTGLVFLAPGQTATVRFAGLGEAAVTLAA